MLSNGMHDVPSGKMATVVTYLEMTAPVQGKDVALPDGLQFSEVTEPTPEFYRDLFKRVGSEDWLWISRLEMGEAALAAILDSEDTELWTLWREGVAEAILELDFRTAGECELAFFGLTRTLIGSGAGRFLMTQAIRKAWARPISRFHVHTCTLDSPGALSFYRRSGFVPVRQRVEILDDPRLTQRLPQSYGPHIPMFGA